MSTDKTGVKECRGTVWPKLLMEAAKLRVQRKKLEARENAIKAKIKTEMKTRGIRQWFTLSGYRAVLEERDGRPTWDQKLLARALRTTLKGLSKYKKQGGKNYALTVHLP